MKSLIQEKSMSIATVRSEMFLSAQDVVEACKQRVITNSNFKDETQRKRTKDWDGVESYEEALDMLNNGWESPDINKVKRSIDIAVKRSTGKRITFKNDIIGFAPVVPLALLGVPNAMINSTMKPIKSKVVNIFYDITVNCGYSAKDILNNGIKVIEAIISLEMQGYRVGLNAVQSYNDKKGSKLDCDMLVVQLKTPNQPLDIKRVMFPLCHPAMFRVIGFDWYSKFPKGVYRYGYGSDLVRNLNDEQLKQFTKELFGKESIYLSGAKILRGSAKHIEEQLKEDSKINK